MNKRYLMILISVVIIIIVASFVFFYEFELAICNKNINRIVIGPYCYKKTTLYNAWIAGDVGFFELVGSVMRLLLAMAIFVIELPMRIVLGGLRRVIEGLGWLAVSFVELFD